MTYLTQAHISDDLYMRYRVSACAAQEGCTEESIDPDGWAFQWRRVWASAPDWDDAWEYARNMHPPETEPDYAPGADEAVITDGMILSQVQAMKPFIQLPTIMVPIQQPPGGW